MYATCSACGCTLDNFCDPRIYTATFGLHEFYCSNDDCLAKSFGDCIDTIFSALDLSGSEIYIPPHLRYREPASALRG